MKYITDTKDFQHRLLRARINKCLTQVELARQADVARQTIANWETGRSRPRLGLTVKAVAETLDVSVGWLLLGDETLDIPTEWLLLEK